MLPSVVWWAKMSIGFWALWGCTAVPVCSVERWNVLEGIKKCIWPEKGIIISEALHLLFQVRNPGHLWLNSLHNGNVLLLEGKTPLQLLPRREERNQLFLSYPHLINAPVYIQGFGQDICLFLGLVAEVIADSPELHTFGSNRVHSVVIALDQLVTMQCVELGLL